MIALDYLERLLKKEHVKLSPFQALDVEVSEMLMNRQDVRNVTQKLMDSLDLVGDVALFQYVDNQYELISFLGKEETCEGFADEGKVIVKKQNSHPTFGTEDDSFQLILPIFSKESFLGYLAILTKQDILCWDELYVFMFKTASIFLQYAVLIENREYAVTDLTGLFNQEHFYHELDITMQKIDRYGDDMNLILLQIQDFNIINHKLGYQAGIELLKQVGQIIYRELRKIDMPARLENSTFAISLDRTPEEGAHVVLLRLLQKIHRHTFRLQNHDLKIRMNSSVIPYERDKYTLHSFLEHAQNHLTYITPSSIETYLSYRSNPSSLPAEYKTLPSITAYSIQQYKNQHAKQ